MHSQQKIKKIKNYVIITLVYSGSALSQFRQLVSPCTKKSAKS